MNKSGILSSLGYTGLPPTTTNTGWRIADALDQSQIHNATIGDMIIDGPNPGSVSSTYPNGFIDIRVTFGNLIKSFNGGVDLAPGKKIIIRGGTYDYIYMEMPDITGTSLNPIIITNYNGQVKSKSYFITGAIYFKWTGKYDYALKTGDSQYTGHTTSYSNNRGRYGFLCDKEWSDLVTIHFAVGGTSTVRMANNFEIEYVELRDGGGTGFNIKEDNPDTYEDMTFSIHDTFVHNICEEAFYLGYAINNTNQHILRNVKIYNNRAIWVGNEGLQLGQAADGCDIYNNFFIVDTSWTDPFGPYQDRGNQINSRNGDVKYRNNIVLNSADYQIILSNAPGTGGTDNPVAGKDVEITNNLFKTSRNLGLYIDSATDNITGFKINNNWFLSPNFSYDLVYNVTNPNAIMDIANTTTPVQLNNNKYQAGKTFIRQGAGNPNITQSGNTTVTSIAPLKFVQSGYPLDFDYEKIRRWTATIGPRAGFPSSGTKKGQPLVFNTGDWCIYKSLHYRSKIDNNSGNEPQGVSDAAWELQYFDQSPYPSFDFRLASDDPYNYLGIGLLDNVTPVAPSIVIDAPNAVARMSTIEGFKSELSLVAEEQGSNLTLLRFGKPWAKLTNGLRVGALGSSTLYGAGASTGFTLHDRLAAQVATIPNAEFIYNAVSGTYSDYYVPDGANVLSDWNRNVDALLTLNLDILIVSLPSNDISFNTNAQFLANLKLIFNRAKSKGVTCFVTTTQPRDSFTIAEQQRLYDFVSLMKNDPDLGPFTVDVFTPLAQPYSVSAPAKYIATYYSGDGIHPNNAGHGIIFDAIWAKIVSYLTNDYQSYQLQSSSSQNGVYTDINNNISGSATYYNVTRTTNQTIWYKIRGKRLDNSYTLYSDPISFEQPVYSAEIIQTLNVNFTCSTNASDVPLWNKFLPSGDIPDAGESISNITDSNGNITTVDVIIDSSFENSTNQGGSAGVFPLDVIRSYWYWGAGSPTGKNKPQIRISGLDDSYLYDFRFLTSRQGGSPNRYTGAVINSIYRSGISTPTNNSNTFDFKSVKPVGGEVIIKFKALPVGTTSLGYLNAMIIEKHNNINSILLTPPNAVAETSNIIITPSSNTEQTVKIHFTTTGSSGLSDWNDVNPVSNTNIPNLDDSLGIATSIGVTVTNIESGLVDNGSGYVSSVDFPSAISRYGRYRSGSPPMIIKLTNLNVNKLYDIDLYASRKDNSIVQGFTINGNLQTVNVSNNTTPVSFSDISPDGNNEIVITTSYVSGGSGNYQYIQALVLTVKPVAAGSITISTPDAKARFNSINIPTSPGNLVVGPLNAVARASTINIQQTLSPATITTNHNYINPASTTWRMWVFQPEGYLNNSDDYALIIFLAGSGQVAGGTTVANVDDQGIPQIITAGDRPDNRIIICAPHVAGISSWGQTNSFGGTTQMYPKWAYDYMVANYRINPNRVYVTGLSLGAAGSALFAQAYPNLVTAIMPVSGSQPSEWNGTVGYPDLLNIAVWSHHGSADGTQDRTNTPRYAQYMNPLNPKYPPLMSIYYNKGHSSTVWNDEVARRKSSSVSGTKAKFDYDKWFWKFSKDPVETADGHMDYAESTLDIEDYWIAKRIIEALPSSSEKDALVIRLASNLSTILTNKRMFLVDLGDSGNTSASPINNATSNTNNVTTSSLLDILGNSSSYNFVVVNRLSTFTPQKVFSDRMTAEYRGLPKSFNKDGFYVEPTVLNGRVKFTGLNNSRTYSVYVYGCQDLGDTMNQNYEIRVTIGATVVTQYVLFNTTQRIQINNITPTSGEILIDILAPNSGVYAAVSGILLLENL